MTMLDDFADRLKAENKNVYLEIQGHTDSTGADDVQLQARRGAGGGRSALPEQAGRRPEPDVHDLLREGRAGGLEQDQGWAGQEPAGRRHRSRVGSPAFGRHLSAPADRGAFLLARRAQAAAPGKSSGSRRLDAHDTPVRGVGEPEAPRVEHLARRLRGARAGRRPVHAVAEHGVARRREVHANLVRAARLQPDRDEAWPPQSLESPVARDGALPRCPARATPGGGRSRRSRTRSSEGADRRAAPLDDRDVLALDLVRAEAVLQEVESLARAGEDERPRTCPCRGGARRRRRAAAGSGAAGSRDARESSVSLSRSAVGTARRPAGLSTMSSRRPRRARQRRVRTRWRAGRRGGTSGRLLGDLGPARRGGPVDVHAPRPHGLPRGPPREAERPRDGQVEPHGAPRLGTRISTKNWGPDGARPAPGPKDAAGSAPARARVECLEVVAAEGPRPFADREDVGSNRTASGGRASRSATARASARA